MQWPTTSELLHAGIETVVAPVGVVSTLTARVDVAVASLEVAAEKETVVVPSESVKVNVHALLESVDVVANVVPNAEETNAEAVVVPVNVMLVVAKSALSAGDRMESESGTEEGTLVAEEFVPTVGDPPPKLGVMSLVCGVVSRGSCIGAGSVWGFSGSFEVG